MWCYINLDVILSCGLGCVPLGLLCWTVCMLHQTSFRTSWFWLVHIYLPWRLDLLLIKKHSKNHL